MNSTETKLCNLWTDTLTKYLPNNILEWVHKTVKFEYQNGALATSFRKNQFEDEPLNKLLDHKPAEGIVLLHDSLLNEPYEKQEFVILHEIAHLWLKHHSICGKIQEEKENEANEIAKKWIDDYNKYSKQAMTKN